jgi:hypothetical protein
MVKSLFCVLGLTLNLSVASSDAETTAQTVFYVSPQGSDRNPGTETAPFRSIRFAQKAVRKALSDEQAAKITVYLRQGIYLLDETLVFDLRDSAPEGGRVVYSGFPDETAVISAGLSITNWERLKRSVPGLPDKARESIWVASLPQDIPHFNTLYDGEKRLLRARTKGFVPTVPRSKADKYTLHVPSGAIENWANSDDADIRIIPGRPWVLNYVPVVSVEPERNILRTNVPVTYQMASPGFGRFDESAWIENLFEALDQPGEWILDYNQRRLYYWPEKETPGDDIVAPVLTELVRVEGQIDYEGPKDTPVRNLVFQNLTFAHNDRMTWRLTKTGWGVQHDWEMFDKPTAMIRFRGAENCKIANCRLVAGGGTGIRLDLHCMNNLIENNTIEHLGGVGVLLCGYGPGTKDVNKANAVLNNHIHHVGQILWHSPAIFVWQSGRNRIAHNHLHHTPYTPIVVSGRIIWDRTGKGECSKTVRWNEIGDVLDGVDLRAETQASWNSRQPYLHARKNIVELNEIHHGMLGLGDGNAIYVSGCGAFNIIRRNYIHDMISTRVNANIRCDDDQHLTVIERNLIFNCCGEGFITKGKNTIVNNIIYNLVEELPDGRENNHRRGYLVLPWGEVTGSVIQRNIFVSTIPGQKIMSEGKRQGRPVPRLKDCLADYNLFFNSEDPHWASTYLKQQRADGVERNSIFADPLFYDAYNGDFRIKPDSPALLMGFLEFTLENAGVKHDAIRPLGEFETR